MSRSPTNFFNQAKTAYPAVRQITVPHAIPPPSIEIRQTHLRQPG